MFQINIFFLLFCLWIPYVEPDKRLTLILTDDKNKARGVGSSSQVRTIERDEKRNNVNNDTNAVKDFSTDHRIGIESLNIRKRKMTDIQRESALVGSLVLRRMIYLDRFNKMKGGQRVGVQSIILIVCFGIRWIIYYTNKILF